MAVKLSMYETTEEIDFPDDIFPECAFFLSKELEEQLHKDMENEVGEQVIVDENLSSVSGPKYTRTQNNIRNNSFISSTRVIKRKFPGPAGLLPESGTSNKSILQLLETEELEDTKDKVLPLLSQQTNAVFGEGLWREMTKDFDIYEGDNVYEMFNIKWIKAQAFKLLLNHKAPFLAAVIQNLDIVDGKVPTVNVTLKDVTGDIRGTILHSLYEDYSCYFRIGSVLVLKQFGVLSAGYNNHCLTITPNNLISIYCQELPKTQSNKENVNVEYRENGFVKVILKDCDVEIILKKFKEDVLEYSQQKQKKTSLRKSTSDAGSSSCVNTDKTNISNKDCVNSKVLQCNSSVKENITTSVIESTTTKDPSPKRKLNTTSAEESTSSYSIKKKFDFKTFNTSFKTNECETGTRGNNFEGDNRRCDSAVSYMQISAKPDDKDQAAILSKLLEGVDTDALFDDF